MNRLIFKWLVVVSSFLFITSSYAEHSTVGKIDAKTDSYVGAFSQFYGLHSTRNLTLLKIKGYQQTTGYTCGPAAAMSLMHYYGMLSDSQMTAAVEMKLAKEMKTSRKKGTSPQQLVDWLKHNGFDVQQGENGTLEMLQDYLKKGVPVMVEWIDWGGHWVITAGYNKDGKTPEADKDSIYFADPSVNFDNVKSLNGLLVFNPDRFQSMWFDAQYFNPGHLVKGIYIIATPKKKIA